jgi:hypothetical protein
MRVFDTVLGIAGFLIVPWASADYSFSFDTRGQHDRTGASSSLSGAASLSGPASGAQSSSTNGGTAHGNLASFSDFTAGFLDPSNINSDAAGLDSALDCFDSSSTLPNAPRFTKTCWLIAIAASRSGPLRANATDAYPLQSSGSKSWNDSYLPPSFGGKSADLNGIGPTDNRTGGSGSPVGKPIVSTSGTPATRTSGEPVAVVADASPSHSALDVRGSDISSAPTQSIVDGTDSFSHHHSGSGNGDTSTGLSPNIIVPAAGYAGDPVFSTGTDPLFSTNVEITGPASTLNTTIDPLDTAPSLNDALLAPVPVPEPGTLALVGLALVAIAILPRRKLR